MTCGYNFTLEHYQVMSKACYDCPNKLSDCSRLDCIPADGVDRAIAVVNRIMPGPSIRVRKIFKLNLAYDKRIIVVSLIYMIDLEVCYLTDRKILCKVCMCVAINVNLL